MGIRDKINCLFGHHDWRIYLHTRRRDWRVYLCTGIDHELWIGEKCRDCGRTRNFVEAKEEDDCRAQ